MMAEVAAEYYEALQKQYDAQFINATVEPRAEPAEKANDKAEKPQQKAAEKPQEPRGSRKG